MNSQFIISENINLYKEFFNKYDLVISTPLHFPIIGDTSIYGKGNGYLLSQKIPFRNYIGVNFLLPLNEINFIYKDNINTDFKNGKIENFYPLNKELLKRIGLDYDIGFLSEYNWNNSPAIISNILTTILLLKGVINLKDIENFDIEKKYHKYLQEIIKLDKKLMDDYDFFSNVRNNSAFLGGCMLKSSSHIITIGNSNYNLKYKNMGKNLDFDQLDLSINIINSKEFIKTNYNPKFLIERENSLKIFFQNLGIDTTDIDITDWLETFSKNYSLKVYQNLYYLFTNNPLGNNFFLDIFSYRESLKSIFRSFQYNGINISKIKNFFKTHLQNNYSNFFIDQMGFFGDSRLILFSNKIGFIDEYLISELNNKTGLDLILDYSSYYDGYEKDGVKLEQYKHYGIISKYASNIEAKFLEEQQIYIKTIDKDSINSLKGIILSKINKKIYINGEKITSKELYSQTFTIELFDILLDNLGKEISNEDIPYSAYSKNKNEILSKIIIPFKKIVEENLGEKIEIECYGNLYSYKILLKYSTINLVILNRTQFRTLA